MQVQVLFPALYKPLNTKGQGAAVAHLRFWFGDRKFFRSLKTTDETVAQAKLWRANETFRRLEQGDLVLPNEITCDQVFDFVISGGQKLSPPKVVDDVTLEQVIEDYFCDLPEGTKEGSSLRTEKTHLKHAARLLKPRTQVRSLTVTQVQRYVTDRLKERGQRGKNVQPGTIKKELQTIKQVWDFARVRGIVEGDSPTLHAKLPKTNEKLPFQTWEQLKPPSSGVD